MRQCRSALVACASLLFLLEIRISWPAAPAWEGGGLFYCALLGKFGYLTDEQESAKISSTMHICHTNQPTSLATHPADEE